MFLQGIFWRTCIRPFD